MTPVAVGAWYWPRRARFITAHAGAESGDPWAWRLLATSVVDGTGDFGTGFVDYAVEALPPRIVSWAAELHAARIKARPPLAGINAVVRGRK